MGSFLLTAVVQSWRQIAFLCRLFFVCRVSLVSAIGGIVLFLFVVQAQDLFADVSHGSDLSAFSHWLKFFIALFFLWAFPVHYAARQALDDDGWIVRAALRRRLHPQDVVEICRAVRRDHETALALLPRFLGLMPFAAVMIGLCEVRGNVLAVNIDEANRTLTLTCILGAITAAATVLFAVFVIYRKQVVARIAAKRQISRVYSPKPDSIFSVLFWISMGGTFSLFVLAYFMPVVFGDQLPRAALVPLLFGSLVLLLGWIGIRSHRDGVPYLLLVACACALATGFNVELNDLRGIPSKQEDGSARQVDLADAVKRWRRANGCVEPTAKCPPALIIAADGGASRAAFTTATVVGALLDQTMATKDGGVSAGRRIFAISGVSGGAVGAVLARAALADAAESRDRPEGPPCRRLHRTWYRTKEFWDKTERVGGNHPLPDLWRECLQILAAGDFLTPAFIGIAFRDNLAPPSHLLSEWLRIFDRAALLERALERHYDYVTSAEGSRVLETGAACGSGSPKAGLCRPFGYQASGSDNGRWLPLLALNGTSVYSGRRIVTGDLASVGTPRLALYPQAYDLFEMRSRPCEKPKPDNGDEHRCPAAQASDAPDIYYSTAALTSARFPVISPAGVIETGSHGMYGDAIVDGGYFDNAGLVTALDIARAVAHQGVTPVILSIANAPETETLNIEVPPRPTQTPVIHKIAEHDVWRGLMPRIFGVLGAPFATLLGTRNGHDAEARTLVKRSMPELKKIANGQPNDEPEKLLFNISLRASAEAKPPGPEYRCPSTARKISMPKLSMSWWLSAVVQGNIDVQVLCTEQNKETLRALLTKINVDSEIRR